MDIFNINIHHITNQYLEYIKSMRKLDLEVAGEFVAMAATLLQIKSRMLLPQYTEEGEEVAEDPRKDLVQKLLEYKKIKELSAELYKLPLLGRDVFARGERAEIESLDEGELILDENPLFSLIAAYRTAVKNMKKTVHRVFGELQSIAARILEMKELLVVGQRTVFKDLITDKEKPSNQVLVTFLSLLELAKIGFVSLFQSENLGDIYIEAKKSIDRDVVSQVENYDGVNADQKAQEMMNKAQLSLDESVHSVDDETGEAPIVQESEGDAATDDDIEAEERRLAAEEAGIPYEPEASAETAIEAAAATVPELNHEADGYIASADPIATATQVELDANTTTTALVTSDVNPDITPAAEWKLADAFETAAEPLAEISEQPEYLADGIIEAALGEQLAGSLEVSSEVLASPDAEPEVMEASVETMSAVPTSDSELTAVPIAQRSNDWMDLTRAGVEETLAANEPAEPAAPAPKVIDSLISAAVAAMESFERDEAPAPAAPAVAATETASEPERAQEEPPRDPEVQT